MRLSGFMFVEVIGISIMTGVLIICFRGIRHEWQKNRYRKMEKCWELLGSTLLLGDLGWFLTYVGWAGQHGFIIKNSHLVLNVPTYSAEFLVWSLIGSGMASVLCFAVGANLRKRNDATEPSCSSSLSSLL